jgi:ELP3 family radical SAM enzyme/protein acetyltransferase
MSLSSSSSSDKHVSHSDKHLSQINILSKSETELLKHINNPRVIRTIKRDWLKRVDPAKLDSYVSDIIDFWHTYIESQDNSPINFTASKKEITTFIRTLDKKYRLPSKPCGATIISHLRDLFQLDKISPYTLITLMDILTTKNRFWSGILEIAIMTGPGEFSCKFDCYYCPNQKGIARSYIKEEPAVRRAAQNDFDCVKQIEARISSYLAIGQPGDKGEFIILGGTFSNYSDEYRTEFMRDLYYACNTFYDEIKRSRRTLDEEKTINETALFKVIGITVETRPDCIDDAEILRYISYGVTRVQLGIQHTDDRILKKINRQCYTKDTRHALSLLKKAGFKVLCHYMPNLPTATPEGDIEMFNNVIYDSSLICDEWKIYPTSVTTTSDKDIEDVFTVIEKWFNDGKYEPYSYEELERVIRYAKNHCPKYIRISRIFRDIPVDNIIGGADIPHMRQKIQKKMAHAGEFCKCIRCREIKNRCIDIKKVYIEVEEYEAQDGTEFFISANYDGEDDMSFLVGFCRLRIDHSNDGLDYLPHLKNSAKVRELHVYGKMVPSYLSKILESNTQHKGIGTKMMKYAEMIAVHNNRWKMVVISGVGVRNFYKNKLGYHIEHNYMVRYLYIDYITMILFKCILFLLGCTLIYYGMVGR